jgi:hypothetical protein
MHTFSFLYVCSLKLFYLVKVSVLHTFYIRDIDIFGITVIMSVSRKVCFPDSYDPMLYFHWSRMTCIAWDSKMVHYNRRMERT